MSNKILPDFLNETIIIIIKKVKELNYADPD